MTISVFLADDNLLVREGVRALMELEEDLEVVGVAGELDELLEGVAAAQPQVLVTDIRMPPQFRRGCFRAGGRQPAETGTTDRGDGGA